MGSGAGNGGDARPGVAAALVFGAVVLVTAGVVAPIADGGDDALKDEARRQAAEIGAALRDFLRDCGPALSERRDAAPRRLYGPGVTPGTALADAPGFPLSGVLCRDELGLGAAWKGPYLARVPIDPWGRAWIAHVPAAGSDAATWVASAGGDGVVDTTSAGDVSPDDVGIDLLR